ncbi:MAG TPA: hypothetical protein VL500_05875 [Candidatus Eisenbacteria bacterium]|jgi:hypothetical protein|nr:hypothetical protein [Candidatus Eisenbacteria bacterium]
MSTQNDTASNATDSSVKADANGKSEPTVVVDQSVLDEAAAATGAATTGTPTVEKTEAMPIPPVATAPAGDTAVPPAASPTAPAAGKDDDDDAQVPLNDGRNLKYGLGALGVLAIIGLFIVGYMVLRNSAPTPTVVIPAPASAPVAGAAPAATLPEVRTPAPRLIDATGCRRGQYRIEGNQLVFTNCATLELSETAR